MYARLDNIFPFVRHAKNIKTKCRGAAVSSSWKENHNGMETTRTASPGHRLGFHWPQTSEFDCRMMRCVSPSLNQFYANIYSMMIFYYDVISVTEAFRHQLVNGLVAVVSRCRPDELAPSTSGLRSPSRYNIRRNMQADPPRPATRSEPICDPVAPLTE